MYHLWHGILLANATKVGSYPRYDTFRRKAIRLMDQEREVLRYPHYGIHFEQVNVRWAFVNTFS